MGFMEYQQNRINVCIMVTLEGKEKEKGTESLSKEIMTENFPNLRKEMDIQIHEDQKTPNRLNPKRVKPKHIIIKLTKVKEKEKNLKAAVERQRITHTQAPPLDHQRKLIILKVKHLTLL